MSRKGTQQPLDSCRRECFNTVAALAVFATVFPEADTPFNFTGRTNTTPYNMPDTTPRLDILLYAHDGRGIGHVSRTIAIGIALRRIFPDLRVLFLSGSRFSQELIGSAPLDWIKLPSYETVISNGKSTGTSGHSNFEDSELGRLRGEQIRQIVAIYRPRVVLADHSPQGKHRELIPALEARIQDGEAARWVLGIRGVVGQVKQISSDLAASVFKKFYSSLLWYGDSKVLGKSHLKEIEAQFGCRPHECGYVSSLRERTVESNTFKKDPLLGTISIPWFGEKTADFLNCLHSVLKESDEEQYWHIYLDQTHPRAAEFSALFAELPGCRVEAPSKRYLHSLLHSQKAIIYGGYNSLMDVLSLSLPALVILRDMRDNEQQEHLDRLLECSADTLTTLTEECSNDQLAVGLRNLAMLHQPSPIALNLDGAKEAAQYLGKLL